MPKKTKFDGRICNLVPSKGTDKDWTYEDAVASTALRSMLARSSPAAEVVEAMQS